MNGLKNCRFYVTCVVTCEECGGVGSFTTKAWRDAFRALGMNKSMEKYGKWFAQKGYIHKDQANLYDLFPPMSTPCLPCGGKGYHEKHVPLEMALAALGLASKEE